MLGNNVRKYCATILYQSVMVSTVKNFKEGNGEFRDKYLGIGLTEMLSSQAALTLLLDYNNENEKKLDAAVAMLLAQSMMAKKDSDIENLTQYKADMTKALQDVVEERKIKS
jgi:hypothetical protein